MIIASKPAVLVVAAPSLLRQGLLALLRQRWPNSALTLTADATQVVELVARRSFGVLVLDGALPGLALPGLLAQLRRVRPAQRLLVLADARAPARRGPPLVEAHAHTHAPLLVPRHAPPGALAHALSPWLDGPPADAPLPMRPARAPAVTTGFSPRELEVLRLVVDDHCNDEIADCLCVSVRTVESHRRNLLQKAGTRTLVGLAARAVREGWVA